MGDGSKADFNLNFGDMDILEMYNSDNDIDSMLLKKLRAKINQNQNNLIPVTSAAGVEHKYTPHCLQPPQSLNLMIRDLKHYILWSCRSTEIIVH